MKKIFTGIAVMTTAAYVSQANSQDYGAQIDALQNELLKMKQQMNTGDKGKAYFEKGKGLRVKSTDGKYMFQIKGRLMYDVGGLLNYETETATDTDSKVHEGGFGSEFRRLRFTIKGEVGNGWGFAFQPDFADGSDDRADRTVVFKDALIYKKMKGLGKVTFGNQKAAAGLYENTSSNNLIFMERPMHNENMNFGHRAGLGYDTSGAFGKKFHLKATLFHGHEASIEQNISDGGDGADNESLGFSVATQYQVYKDKDANASALLGFHYGYFDISNIETDAGGGTTALPDRGEYDTNSSRANGIHTMTDKPIDLGDIVNAKDHYFFGPSFSAIYGQFFTQGEYQIGKYTFVKDAAEADAAEDHDIHGGSISVAYAFSGKWKHSTKKGALSGFKCKANCFMPKYQYEFIDATDYDENGADTNRNGGSGQVHTFGFNHYFNSNVRAMVEYSYGDYGTDDSQSRASSEISAIQARLHLKY